MLSYLSQSGICFCAPWASRLLPKAHACRCLFGNCFCNNVVAVALERTSFPLAYEGQYGVVVGQEGLGSYAYSAMKLTM